MGRRHQVKAIWNLVRALESVNSVIRGLLAHAAEQDRRVEALRRRVEELEGKGWSLANDARGRTIFAKTDSREGSDVRW